MFSRQFALWGWALHVRLWYAYHMRVIVVTGGLGSGKSTAAEHFRAKGASSLTWTRWASSCSPRDRQLLERVAEAFGDEEILLADGRLDRAALARAAFASPEASARGSTPSCIRR